MMETLLTLEGHTVRTAATGEEAIRVALEWLPDIALVDIGLPDIDGHEVVAPRFLHDVMNALTSKGQVKG